MKSTIHYPFSAVVGQEEMKLAVTLNLIDPAVGGVLIMGERGTGKSTLIRALPDLLPQMSVVSMCLYGCDPDDEESLCLECNNTSDSGAKLGREKRAVPVVELPLGATEDRVCGTIDIEQALAGGVKRFEPGLLARANRGFLYIDEVNLLEDHLVDLLLDVAVTGVNKVERESISVEHPARFVLIGSGNPEEGELRPQLLDRFGLYVEVKTEDEIDRRVEIVERRDAFERDREGFRLAFAGKQQQLRKKITRARKNLGNVKMERGLLKDIARLCSELKVDGHRGELTITRAARALAAFEGRKKLSDTDVKRVAIMALRHRLRRGALEEAPGAERIEQALEKVFATRGGSRNNDEGGSDGERKRFPADVSREEELRAAQRRAQGSRRPVSSNGQTGADKATMLPVPLMEENVPPVKFAKNTPRKSTSTSRFQSSRQITSTKPVYNRERGRYARSISASVSPRRASSRIALDATLRALITSTFQTSKAGASPFPLAGGQQLMSVPSGTLRFKLFKRKQGRLFIFAIDLSGSMALNRIAQAKATMLGLLRQSYIKRDSVAIVAFRGTSAELLLPPSRSILRARRVLDSLEVGGGTPLSAGLACALQLAKQTQVRQGELTLLLFTDGHANVSISTNGKPNGEDRRLVIESEVRVLGAGLKRAGVKTVLVDTQNRFTANDAAHALARTLGADYQTLQPGAGISDASIRGNRR
ncbi:MAG TPA: magnesium chelatase ATPase subunit I [Pyrinomonadaceae bacterium]|jgi:magnesium chelatase subunit D